MSNFPVTDRLTGDGAIGHVNIARGYTRLLTSDMPGRRSCVRLAATIFPLTRRAKPPPATEKQMEPFQGVPHRER